MLHPKGSHADIVCVGTFSQHNNTILTLNSTDSAPEVLTKIGWQNTVHVVECQYGVGVKWEGPHTQSLCGRDDNANSTTYMTSRYFQ